jgi:hypothetical protein
VVVLQCCLLPLLQQCLLLLLLLQCCLLPGSGLLLAGLGCSMVQLAAAAADGAA